MWQGVDVRLWQQQLCGLHNHKTTTRKKHTHKKITQPALTVRVDENDQVQAISKLYAVISGFAEGRGGENMEEFYFDEGMKALFAQWRWHPRFKDHSTTE